MSGELEEAKQRLLEKLGPQYSVYVQLLGKWFRGFISKEEFDKGAKQLIKQNFVSEHNRFWLAFFHHCAHSANSPIQSSGFQFCNMATLSERMGFGGHLGVAGSLGGQTSREIPTSKKVRCLPSKVVTHMKIFVIVWEMGLDSINDQVSIYINLALQHFLKTIITELLCTKTAYRLRENRFKYAIGVKPMNPYLNNSLRIYTSNLEYDPYQIESNKMNSSLLDTCVYNDSLFPFRLYEAQALYEFACSTTSVIETVPKERSKRPCTSDIFLNEGETLGFVSRSKEKIEVEEEFERKVKVRRIDSETETKNRLQEKFEQDSENSMTNHRRVTMYHLMIALLSNRTLIPSQSLYSMNIERIFSRFKTLPR